MLSNSGHAARPRHARKRTVALFGDPERGGDLPPQRAEVEALVRAGAICGAPDRNAGRRLQELAGASVAPAPVEQRPRQLLHRQGQAVHDRHADQQLAAGLEDRLRRGQEIAQLLVGEMLEDLDGRDKIGRALRNVLDPRDPDHVRQIDSLVRLDGEQARVGSPLSDLVEEGALSRAEID